MKPMSLIQAPGREPGDRCPLWPSAPRGFTLTELLVVIGIIAVLVAMVTPAVMNARKAARVAAVKAELDMLHKAMLSYQLEYGSFPPCVSGTLATDPAARHLQRLFPRCTNVQAQMGSVGVTPQTALVRWLLGFTGDPTSPLQPQSARRKILDFDASRIAFDPSGTAGSYTPPNLPDSPFVYIDRTAYGTPNAPTPFVVGAGTYQAQVQVLATGTTFFKPDSFQILSAGLDREFGNDDDMSNFWPGTRRQYLDSLRSQ